jgi:hypothetical protein
MNAKHTPGPWSVKAYDTTFQVLDSEGLNVVKTSWHNRIRHPYPLRDEAWANAQLAATAPELLEALEWTWRVLRAAGLQNLTRGVQLGQTSWYVKISDAEAASDLAVAKAKGGVKLAPAEAAITVDSQSQTTASDPGMTNK